MRTIAGRVRELLVAKTAWSYTYSQPKSPIDYHGTVEIQPIDKKTSKLLYTLVYDADALPKHEAEDKAKDKAQPHQAVHRPAGDHEGPPPKAK